MAQKDLKYMSQDDLVFDSGISQPIFIGDQMTVVLTVVGTGTVIALGSSQQSPPDFTVASTIDNSYVEVMLADYTTPNTYYAGSTGVTVAASTAIVEINTNLLSWIAISVSGLTPPEVKITSTNNQ